MLLTGVLSAGPQPPGIPTAPAPAQDAKAAAGLEALFHGEWKGGPGAGELALKADGTYTRKHWSPGDDALSGKWSVRWDALPPTLVMTCEASDDKDLVGRKWEVKVLRLDKENLEYQLAKEAAVRYERVNAGTDARRLRGVWRVVREEHPDAKREKWVGDPRRDATFTFTDGHVTLANTGSHPGYRLTLDEGKKTLAMQSDNPIGFLLLYHGRYRLDGDRLTICLGGGLPDDFTPKAPASRLYHLERARLDLRDAGGKVIVAADEITAYDWATHTIDLKPGAVAKLQKAYADGKRLAVPFAVAVGGRTVYRGELTSVGSSQSCRGVVILPGGRGRKKDTVVLQLGYPAESAFEGKDPRGDATIKTVLEATGKLK